MWNAICTVLREVSAQVADDPPRALSISALGEAFTPVDEQGEFLYNTIVSPDARAVDQAERLRDALGEQRVFEITGMPLHSSFTLPKIMWMRENRPDLHERTWKYLLWPDMVFFKLGLEPRLDWSLAGRTMAFDVVKKTWSEEMLEAAAISPDLFAEPIASGEVVGEISQAASEATGLPKGCLVVSGGHDQPMNALGAGIIREGRAVDGMGTVECITVAFDRPVLTRAMLANNYCCYPHVYGEMYASIAFTYSSGSILRWYRDNFGRWYREQAERTGADVYDLLLADLPEGPTGLFVVPYFAGSGTPYLDAMARGPWAGFPAVDLRAILTDGSHHEVDSSDLAFRTCAAAALRKAFLAAGPRLLEPVMRVNVVVPAECSGVVVSNLCARRGRITAMEHGAQTHEATALVPLAEMFGYATDLRNLTQGRGTFTMEFSRYDPVPESVARALLRGVYT